MIIKQLQTSGTGSIYDLTSNELRGTGYPNGIILFRLKTHKFYPMIFEVL